MCTDHRTVTISMVEWDSIQQDLAEFKKLKSETDLVYIMHHTSWGHYIEVTAYCRDEALKTVTEVVEQNRVKYEKEFEELREIKNRILNRSLIERILNKDLK